MLISDDIHQMLSNINEFFPSQSCLYYIDLLSGSENIVNTSNEVIKFSCRVTDVSTRSLSEIWKVIMSAKYLMKSWIAITF